MTFFSDKLFVDQPEVYLAPELTSPGVQGLYFDAPDYQGKPTRTFSWLGVPALKEGRTCPGIVLVHGGGGTAYSYWVRLWNSRGYAAIAIDTCGCQPTGEDSADVPERHEYGGPGGWGCFGKAEDNPKEQWVYHAVSDIILAHNLLRSQPGVDASRIGITGISWGGFLTCIAAGLDDRFAFAMPVYGCGFIDRGSVWSYQKYGGVSDGVCKRWDALWDPRHYLPAVQCPMLWMSGTNDFAFHLPSWQDSYRLVKTPRTVCLKVEMPHGHGGPGENPVELHVFADSIVKEGQGLAEISIPQVEGNQLRAKYKSARPVMRAELCYTRAEGYWPDRKYQTLPADLDHASGMASSAIPKETKACFLNLVDDRNCIVSTEHILA